MAIKTGIEPGAILWKGIQTTTSYMWNSEEGKNVPIIRERYYIVELTTRRGRTQGSNVEKELHPFLHALNIKLIPYEFSQEERYIAVGTRLRWIHNRDLWERTQVNEVAQRWYARMKNKNVVSLLSKRNEEYSSDILVEMREHAEDDKSEVSEWPPEVDHYEYSNVINPNTRWIPVTWE